MSYNPRPHRVAPNQPSGVEESRSRVEEWNDAPWSSRASAAVRATIAAVAPNQPLGVEESRSGDKEWDDAPWSSKASAAVRASLAAVSSSSVASN
jgi:hypothetical protein